MCSGRESPSRCDPTKSAAMNPTQYWPWPPMLKSPQRKANATASAVRISGAMRMSVCWRSFAAASPGLAGDPGEEPVEPGAGEDRLVRGDGVVPRDRDDETADQEREHGRGDRDEDAADAGREPVAPTRLGRRRPRLVGHQAASSPPRPPVMAMPSSSSETSRPYSADDPALVDDEDPVGEREDLVELERDEQDRRGPRPAPRRAAGARTRSRRRRARGSAGRRRGCSGRARPRARR